jgi:hypothetical protein
MLVVLTVLAVLAWIAAADAPLFVQKVSGRGLVTVIPTVRASISAITLPCPVASSSSSAHRNV